VRDNVRTKLGIHTSVVVGHVGLFHTWDHLDALIQVMSEIHDIHPGAKALLVGDGPEMKSLQESVGRLGLEETVLFTGSVTPDDVPGYIDAMDVCVLPDSNVFGSPIALFEFMAMGKPSVVPDLGPMLDVMEDSVTALIFPHGDYTSLRNALLRLIEDPQLREALGTRAREVVFERHTWNANARLVACLAGDERAKPAIQLNETDCKIRNSAEI
jgi:glycosyltransferase involved in cell wall biosynthesis